MLRIEIITVGKVKSSWAKAGQEHYTKLLGKYAQVELKHVKEGDSAHLPGPQVMRTEAERLLSQIDDTSYSIVLDATGDSLSSEQLAKLLDRLKKDHSRLQFVIGGAFGLDPQVRKKGDLLLSLSKMTLPHELVPIVLLEQLYRALSISAGSKYHK